MFKPVPSSIPLSMYGILLTFDAPLSQHTHIYISTVFSIILRVFNHFQNRKYHLLICNMKLSRYISVLKDHLLNLIFELALSLPEIHQTLPEITNRISPLHFMCKIPDRAYITRMPFNAFYYGIW